MGQGPDLDGFAIYALGFKFQNGTEMWAPEPTLTGCKEQTGADIASKHVHTIAWGQGGDNIQPHPSGPIAWVKEITCNIVRYEVATFSEDHIVTGVYNATVSQACKFKIQNYVSLEGDDEWWWPTRPEYSPVDMTENISFIATEGYQIVGVDMSDFGAGNLTKIPTGFFERPVPSASNGSKHFLRR